MLCSFFWVIPGVGILYADVSEHCLINLHRRCKQNESAYTAYEDGTDKVFRNVRI